MASARQRRERFQRAWPPLELAPAPDVLGLRRLLVQHAVAIDDERGRPCHETGRLDQPLRLADAVVAVLGRKREKLTARDQLRIQSVLERDIRTREAVQQPTLEEAVPDLDAAEAGLLPRGVVTRHASVLADAHVVAGEAILVGVHGHHRGTSRAVEPFDHGLDRHGPEVVAVEEKKAIVDPVDRRDEPPACLIIRVRRDSLDMSSPPSTVPGVRRDVVGSMPEQ